MFEGSAEKYCGDGAQFIAGTVAIDQSTAEGLRGSRWRRRLEEGSYACEGSRANVVRRGTLIDTSRRRGGTEGRTWA